MIHCKQSNFISPWASTTHTLLLILQMNFIELIMTIHVSVAFILDHEQQKSINHGPETFSHQYHKRYRYK